MRIFAWLLAALSIGVLGFGVVFIIVLGNEYGFGAGLLSVVVIAVGLAAIPTGIANSLFGKKQDRQLGRTPNATLGWLSSGCVSWSAR